MLNQTKCASFKNYGDNISLLPNHVLSSIVKTSIYPTNEYVDGLYLCESDIYISKVGSILLLVSKNCYHENIQEYVISESVKLKKGIYYNLIPISKNCEVDIYNENNVDKFFNLDKPYKYVKIAPSISINEIYIRLYQEKGINYIFNGEKHYFWELTFVDRGVLYTNVDGIDFKLKQGDFMFYSSYQFHRQFTDNKKSCSYLTICFSFDFEYKSHLLNKVFTCNKELLYIMSKLITELNNPCLYSSDLCICYLKELILKSIALSPTDIALKPTNKSQQYFDNTILNEILSFIDDNIYEYIDINQICENFGVSNSKLQSIFKANLRTTIRSYINDLKLKKSKELIRESTYTISQISDLLGFNSIHYFSKKFKLVYGYSPTEYLKSINVDK